MSEDTVTLKFDGRDYTFTIQTDGSIRVELHGAWWQLDQQSALRVLVRGCAKLQRERDDAQAEVKRLLHRLSRATNEMGLLRYRINAMRASRDMVAGLRSAELGREGDQ